jgi:hypothetical protein
MQLARYMLILCMLYAKRSTRIVIIPRTAPDELAADRLEVIENTLISKPISMMTICSNLSECRLDTDSLSSCSISCKTSTRELRRLMRWGISR